MTTFSLTVPSPLELLGIGKRRETQPAPTTAAPGPTPAAAPAGPTPGSIVLEFMRATYTPPAGAPTGSPTTGAPTDRFNSCDHRPTTCAPAPGRGEHSCAPSGSGLTKNQDGSITTAGGYKIVPEGKDQAWSIYDPQGKQLTRVWGDPHVNEADGTKWDFTKDSTFTLPDGTRIGVDTTSETGRSVTRGLDIANGRDRVQVGGIDQDKPTVGNVTRDGMRGWQRDRGEQDTFKLRHDAMNQDWVKYSPDGRRQGVVTGSEERDGAYQQITNGVGSDLDQTRVRRGGGNDDVRVGREPTGGPSGGPAAPTGGNPVERAGGGNGCAGPERQQDSAMDPRAFFQLLAQLFGGNDFGGMGRNGTQPEDGCRALQQLQQLMFQALLASQMQGQQVDRQRYAGINGICGR